MNSEQFVRREVVFATLDATERLTNLVLGAQVTNVALLDLEGLTAELADEALQPTSRHTCMDVHVYDCSAIHDYSECYVNATHFGIQCMQICKNLHLLQTNIITFRLYFMYRQREAVIVQTKKKRACASTVTKPLQYIFG